MDDITVPALRTKLATNRKIEHVKVIFRLFNPYCTREHKSLSIVKGGVTGYESFCLRDANIARMRIDGWMACMGTEGRWDRLMVPAESMGKVFDHYGLK